jgi:hypothetical protein
MIYVFQIIMLTMILLEIKIENIYLPKVLYCPMKKLYLSVFIRNYPLSLLWSEQKIKNDHRNVPLVVSTSWFYPHLCTYHRVCNYSNTTGTTSGEWTAYPSGAPEFTPDYSRGSVARFLVFCRHCIIVFLLAIVLYVFLQWFTDNIWPFGIIKLSLKIILAGLCVFFNR